MEDRFAPLLEEKVESFGSIVRTISFSPDDPEVIAREIKSHLDEGCDLILITGGMSVDPDDVTRHGLNLAGAQEVYYGAAVLPGSMLLMAYVDDVPLVGVPACGLYHKATGLDLLLPRILCGERIGKAELALMGHGGLCKDCSVCRFPNCPFGKGC